MTETKVCKNCSKNFIVEPDDFEFYKKIDVPAPTWCPECRQLRRYSWRNERILYRRPCDLCGKSTVTIYSANKPFKVYCNPCWWGDGWDALSFGRDFDFNRPFFPQWQELQLQVPRMALLNKNSVNSEYTHHSGDNKNCYMTFSTFNSENVMYCNNVYQGTTRDSMSSYHITGGGELLFECVDSDQCYNCQYGMLLRACNNCSYCFDCRGCSNCFMCYNLRNKQYCILNEQYTKEEYEKKMKEYSFGSHALREQLYGEWRRLISEKALHRFATIERSTNVSGNQIMNSKNIHQMFDANNVEDSKYGVLAVESKDCMDCYHYGLGGSELVYESHGLTRCANAYFTHLCYDNLDIQYCDTCQNSQHLFGCVGIKKGSWIIFNKRYDEKSFKELRARIIAHMRKSGEYGEFFPPSLSPIGYNETQGQIYMPMAKEEAFQKGFKWEDLVPGTFGKGSIDMAHLPDRIEDVEDTIMKTVLTCMECRKNYNVVLPELQLLRRLHVPVPRLCLDCRYIRRIALRPPRKLWHRACMNAGCKNEFETPYAPERPEKVYCEACYNAEVV